MHLLLYVAMLWRLIAWTLKFNNWINPEIRVVTNLSLAVNTWFKFVTSTEGSSVRSQIVLHMECLDHLLILSSECIARHFFPVLFGRRRQHILS